MNKRLATTVLCLSFCLSMMPSAAVGAEEDIQEDGVAAVVTQAEEPAAETPKADTPKAAEESKAEEPAQTETKEETPAQPETPAVEEPTEPTTEEGSSAPATDPEKDPAQPETAAPDENQTEQPEETPAQTDDQQVPEEDDGEPSGNAEVVNASGVGTGSSHVGPYEDSPYYESLQNAIRIGDQRRDIVSIALSQVGYCESDSAYDLSGTTAGHSNYTVYGCYTGHPGQAWCASFVSWCAYQAGVSTAVIPVTAGANVGSFGKAMRYDSDAIQPGDIICFNGGTHVGLVYDKDSEYLYTVEGNYSDQVIALRYALNDSSLTYYYSPSYASDWDVEDGNWYYYDDVTESRQTGWITVGNCQFYLDPENDGAAASGWREIEGAWYYFDGEPGIMQTGWQKLDGAWYYLGTDGAMQTGWVTLGSDTFYLEPDTGIMVTGWQRLGEKWYYFDSDGCEQTGWFYEDGWYYLDPKRAGAMVTGWKTVDGDRYYFSSSGVMETGWVLIDNDWYYFESSGRMVTGEYTIDGTAWFFDKNGVWQEFVSQEPEMI